MWNLKKYNKLVNITKEKQTHGYREQIIGCRGKREGERGNIEVGDQEVQTIRYKICYKDILYNMVNIAFYSNYKWSTTFRIVNHYIVHL